MKVAVGVHRTGLNAAGEERHGALAGLEMMHLETVVRLERDPLDVMGRLHGMLGRADRHLDEAPLVLDLDDRNMLLDGTVARIGVKRLITAGAGVSTCRAARKLFASFL